MSVPFNTDGNPGTSPLGPSNATIEWTVHLAAASPTKIATLLLFVVAVSVLSVFVTGSWMGGSFAFLCLMGATAEFLFPIHYAITPNGVSLRRLGVDREMRWDEVRRVRVTDSRALLSPFSSPTRMDAFRGMELRMDPANESLRKRIIESLRARVVDVIP